MNYEQPTLTPEQEWVKISRQLFGEINKHPDIDLAYRLPLPEALSQMSESDQDRAMVIAEQAANDRRGYNQAFAPLRALVMSGKVKSTDAKVWKLTFAIGKKEFRPKFGEVEEMVLSVFEIPRTGADVEARKVVGDPRERSVLGIPATAVKAAHKDITSIPKNATRIEHIPTHDDQGNLIGEGRRKFLLAMTRMKQGLRPLPSGDAFSDGEEEDALRPVSKEQEVAA